MSLTYRLEILITIMCGNMDESTLKAVLLATIPVTWYVSWDPTSESDEKVFGGSNYRMVLDGIRTAVSSGHWRDIQHADFLVGDWPHGLLFYNLLLRLYAKWRDLHLLAASDTDSTSGSVHSEPDLDMGVPQHGLGAHAKLNALRMSMRK
jgi:hypothetical protein